MGLIAFLAWFLYATYMLVQVWVAFQFSVIEYVASVFIWLIGTFLIPLIIWIHGK
jgi:hypothetical protein